MILKYLTPQRLQLLIQNSALALLFCMGTSLAALAQDNGKVVDEIIAKVDNYIVLKSELENTYQEMLASQEFSQGITRCRVLERLVIDKLMLAKAEIDSVIVADEEVAANLNRRMEIMIGQLGSREAIEEHFGKTIEEFEAELHDQMKEQLTIQEMQKTITKDIKITPAEVKRFFNRLPQDSLPFYSSEASVAQIVKLPGVSEDNANAARRQLLDIKERIISGEDFGELAKKHSEDPGSAVQGGDLGWTERGRMVPEFEAAALQLKAGQMSDPIQSDFGFHLIELIERRGNRYHARHILIRPSSSQVDILDAERFLDSLRTHIMKDTISFQKAAKEHSDDKLTAASGGFFLGADGTNRVATEDLDPVVFFTIDTMKIGEITKPIRFRMDDGKQAVRIIYYESSTKPHVANLRDDYQKIYNAALGEKRAKILSEWFDDAKKQVFVDIDKEYDYCSIIY